MSELGSSSDMPFEIRAVHDVCYPGGDNENQLFGLLPGANCAQSSGVIRGQKPTQIEPYGVVPPYIKNQPSGHMGLDMGSHYPPRAPLYSHTGLRPLCCELCSDNGHFPPVWAYQAGLIIYMHMPHIQKRTGRGINGRGRGAPTSPACPWSI